MTITPMSRTPNSGAGRRERAERRRDAALGGHRAGQGEDRDDHPVPSQQHREGAGDVVEGRVPGQAGERRPVVAGLAAERVQDLAEAVRAGVERAGEARLGHRGDGREAEDAGSQHQDDEHRHLHLEGLDLLAQVLGRAPNHQAGDEDAQDGPDDEHAVEPRTDPAGREFAELHVEERDEAAEWLEAVVPGVDGTGARAGRDGRPQGASTGPEPGLLALHVAEGLVDAGGERRVRAGLVRDRDKGADAEDRGHSAEDDPALSLVLGIAAERVGEGEREREHRDHLDEVGQRGRILERVGGVGVEEPAAVVAQLLDELLGRHRATGDDLLRALQGGDRGRSVERLGDALPDEHDGADDRDREEDVQDAAGEVHPVVADGRGAASGQPAHQRDGHGQPGSGRREVADGQERHLDEMARPGLARVVLPVRVGFEADRGVEREVRALRRDAARVERQGVLEPQHHVADDDGDGGHEQDGDGIALPALLDGLVDARDAVDAALDGSQHGTQDRPIALHHPGDVPPQERGDHEDDPEEREQGQEVSKRKHGSDVLRTEQGPQQVDQDQERRDRRDDLDTGHRPTRSHSST